MLESLYKRQIEKQLNRVMQPGMGELVLCEKGKEQFRAGSGEEIAVIDLLDTRTYAALVQGNTATGEAYMRKMWESPDLACLFRVVGRNLHYYNIYMESGVRKTMSRLGEFMTWVLRKSRRRTKSNVSHHYDLGNEMFAKFLDTELQYSCAVFKDGEASLDEAQRHKLELLSSKAQLKPNTRLLDLGCGWGGLSVWAARHHDVEVVALTLSKKQYEFVTERVAREGLTGKITPVLADYRDYKPAEKFNQIISVEMIEAVGPHNFVNYYQNLRDLLKPGGIAVVQAITVEENRYDDARYDIDFVKEYIFPGGACPSQSLLSKLGAGVGFQELDCEDITEHYVPTLAHWRKNFLAAWDEIIKLGYDESFARMMVYYFAYCEAGFATRRTEDVQAVYQRQPA